MEHYIDIPWLAWIVTLVVVACLMPVVLLISIIYLSSLLAVVYRYYYHLRGFYNIDVWYEARDTIAVMWDILGWLWHDYEVVGQENIPESEEGGALLVIYHGAFPVDVYYFLARINFIKKRWIRFVADRFLYKTPGLKPLLDTILLFTGSFQDCVKNLKDGHLVALAPGGSLEAQFGDEEYKLVWGKRIGFAKVALEAQVPIIPIFTQNVREAFRTVKIGRKWLRKTYEKTRIPVVPIYGGFPVKLRTYVGKPIPYDPNVTAEELATKTAQAIQNLIRLHQRVPGSILKGIIDRVYKKRK